MGGLWVVVFSLSLDQSEKLRVVLQEREVMSFNYFKVFLTISNNFVGLSCLSCSISVYLGLFWTILVYLIASCSISVYLDLHQSISDHF